MTKDNINEVIFKMVEDGKLEHSASIILLNSILELDVDYGDSLSTPLAG